jgi:hypothetical protein
MAALEKMCAPKNMVASPDNKNFFQKIEIVGSLRYVYNPEFEGKWNPRMAAVYTLQKSTISGSLTRMASVPAYLKLSFVSNSNVRRVGGLKYINEAWVTSTTLIHSLR